MKIFVNIFYYINVHYKMIQIKTFELYLSS